IKQIDEVLALSWEPIKRGLAVEIAIAGIGKRREFVCLGTTLDVDLSDFAPGTYKVIGRILFKERPGKWINASEIVIGNAAQRSEWARNAAILKADRDRFIDAISGRDRKQNAIALLHDIASRRTALTALPTHISLALGYDCNIDCVMCDEGRVPRPHRVPQSLLDDVVRHALPSLVSIEIIGGEPLFYDETEALCAAAEQHPDLEIVMSTNATLLSEKWARRIAAGNYTLQVSIDGATPETYNAVRRKSDFDKFIANVERARALAFQAGKPWVAGLQFIIMRQNCHEIVEMVGLAQRLCAELHFNIVEYPHGDEALRGMDPLSDRST